MIEDHTRERVADPRIAEAQEILIALRRLTGLSYSALANDAGFAASTVSRFMRRGATPRFNIKPSTLTAIVERAVDVALEDLSADDLTAVTQLAPDDPVPAAWALRRKTAVDPQNSGEPCCHCTRQHVADGQRDPRPGRRRGGRF